VSLLPAGRAERQREIEARERARVEAYDKAMLMMQGKGVAQATPAPAFTEADIEEVGKLLVEGRLRLPKYARVTVRTELEETTSPIFGNSTIFNHLADELCCHGLQPMSIQAALEAKLLTKVGGTWMFRPDVYREMVPADLRLIA
jgi:hypothetical protein